jgi:hypothetical protein
MLVPIMAGVAFVTSLTSDAALAAGNAAATALGLQIRHRRPHQFAARQGSLLRSLLLPPHRPYCNFLVTLLQEDDSLSEIVLESNEPWWTGTYGLKAVEDMFDRFVHAVADAIEKAGGRILKRRRF